ncbi:MAG: serine hydrolase [Pseudomonadota bacterium]
MDLGSLDACIEDTMASWHCPGLAIAVVQDGTVVHQRGFGWRDADQRLPMAADTRFAMGSVTKSFTALSAAQCVDDGLLAWDRPVCQDMPEFLLDDPYVTRHVTLRDMLSHRTGMPRHDYAAWRLALPRAEFIARMRHLKFSASLRERYQYNNLMYAAAAYLVEKVAGRRWEDLVRERILAPLGMHASNLEPAFADEAAHPLALGYNLQRDAEGRFERWVHMPPGLHTELSPGPAGTLFSTAADMARWLQLHLDGSECGGARIVSRHNIQELRTPQMAMPVNDMGYALSGLTMMSYGLGWMVRPYPFAGGTLVFHDGNVEGFSAHVCFVPESRIGVVALANASGSSVPAIAAREAMDRLLGLPARDWNARFHRVHDPLLAAAAKGRTVVVAQKLPQPPSHPLEAYEGSYGAEGYPDFAVRLRDGALQACTVGSMDWSELRHQHYDVFDWHIPLWDSWCRARFTTGERGEVDAVSIPLAAGVPDIVFTRKPAAIDAATLDALAGDYDPGVDGLLFRISHQDGKLYWTETGSPAFECAPRRLGDGTAEFDIERTRIVFTREDGRWMHVAAHTPFASYEARRR